VIQGDLLETQSLRPTRGLRLPAGASYRAKVNPTMLTICLVNLMVVTRE
jgi:hypothetical protein